MDRTPWGHSRRFAVEISLKKEKKKHVASSAHVMVEELSVERRDYHSLRRPAQEITF